MSLPRERGLSRLALLAIPVLALVAIAIVITLGHFSDAADAHTPHPGVDFAIGIDTNANGTDDCTTRAAGPATCPAMTVGAAFLVNYYLVGIGDITYTGFDTFTTYTGVVSQNVAGGPAVMTPGFWPDCGFPASIFTPNTTPAAARFGCAQGLSATAPSTYIGKVATLGFTCAANGDINLKASSRDTSITDVSGSTHAEADGTFETLHVACGTGSTNTPTVPVPTNTVGPPPPTNTTGPSPTATNTRPPTNTVPPTATRTRTNTPPPSATRTATPPSIRGDANGDHMVTSQDALITLQYEAGLRSSLPNMIGADASLDHHINSIDALYILWLVAHLI